MSTIRASNYGDASSDVPAAVVLEGAPKAWGQLQGAGTALYTNSYNMGSITDNGAGDYTVNFTNSFADDAGLSSCGGASTTGTAGFGGTVFDSSSAASVLTDSRAGAALDYANIPIHYAGDLA